MINVEQDPVFQWPQSPWKKSGQTPSQWFESNFRTFVFHPLHILREAESFPSRNIPSCSGIYFLIDGDNEIAYVGIAGDLSSRLDSHWRQKSKPMQKVWAFGGIPKEYIHFVECFYIHALNPPLNRKRIPVDRITEGWINRAISGDLWPDWEVPEWEYDPIMPAR